MQTDGQVIGSSITCEPIDCGWQSYRTDRDTSRADTESICAPSDVQSPQHAIKIGKRLAHPHHDDMTQPLAVFKPCLKQQHLLEDFTSCKIPIHPIESTGAKDTTHRTTNLAAHADTSSRSIAQQDTFNFATVRQTDQQLVCPITGLHRGSLRCHKNTKRLIQLGSQSLGKVTHFPKIGNASLINPMDDLFCAKTGLTMLNQPVLEILLTEVQQVPAFIAGVGCR